MRRRAHGLSGTTISGRWEESGSRRIRFDGLYFAEILAFARLRPVMTAVIILPIEVESLFSGNLLPKFSLNEAIAFPHPSMVKSHCHQLPFRSQQRQSSVHVKVEPSIRVHVVPYQRGQRGVVAWRHPSVPTGISTTGATLPKFRASLG